MGYKHLSVIDFLFNRGSIISVFGGSGTGKTALALHVIKEIGDGVFISTTGHEYKGRIKGRWSGMFVDVSGEYELFMAIIEAVEMDPRVIAIDAINRFYRINRKVSQFLMTLNLLKLARGRVLMTWEMSTNNRVSGHKIMTFYSDDVFRTTGRYIIGNGRRCKFAIRENGVMGCT
ncbi:hypothetical protein L3N51_00861 [Metallosphaera sp. J1]|uniref:AAA family ATPase n=1 Tax=Metallosphaera javensis (ex Hofmann et al. 2022) TaxID=99938 RepID=UPI001EDE2284|nr:AAA family ATPase [Metallosphaera javensis (ex Hofmann et al. 2022)]MCG3108579.1 hypothetical protein [Metallosphaera javensis (ex Hofmann et al. 2022)]